MQYFQAVQIGKERANKAQMILFDIAGFAMLTLTTKKKDGKFLPVGEETYTAIIQTDDGYVTILVDEDGFTKTQSKAVEKDEALKIYNKIKESGISEYSGSQVEIWARSYNTIQNEIQ